MPRTAIKVSIIGAGYVGSTVAYTLMMRALASDIVIVDTAYDKAVGEAMDIEHGLPFGPESTVRAGDYPDTKDSDIVIVTAGSNQKPDETRLDMVSRNAAIMGSIAPQVMKHSPHAVVVVISNPVDIMAYIFQHVTHTDHHLVIGSGTNLDSARFRYLLSHKFNVDSHNVHAYVLGEHGDSEFPAWSLANIAGMGIREASEAFGNIMAEEDYATIGDAARNAAYEIIARKGATYYGIAMSAARISSAILRDEKSILPVSTLLTGEYGLEDVYLSLPCVLGQHGIERVITPRLTDDELSKLHHSAQILREARDSI